MILTNGALFDAADFLAETGITEAIWLGQRRNEEYEFKSERAGAETRHALVRLRGKRESRTRQVYRITPLRVTDSRFKYRPTTDSVLI
jgi:hypothetical protein